MISRILMFSSLFGIAGLAIGCGASAFAPAEARNEAQVSRASVAFTNTQCPIMSGDVDPTGEFALWQGQKIGFCCDGCKAQWEDLSNVEKAEHLASADDDSLAGHGDHDHGSHSR